MAVTLKWLYIRGDYFKSSSGGGRLRANHMLLQAVSALATLRRVQLLLVQITVARQQINVQAAPRK